MARLAALGLGPRGLLSGEETVALLFQPLALQPLTHGVGHRGQELDCLVREGAVREDRGDPDEPVLDEEGITREGRHSRRPDNALLTERRIAREVVGHVGPALERDPADARVSDLDPILPGIHPRSTAGRRTEYQDLFILVQSPDPREGRVEVPHHGLGAAVEHRLKRQAGLGQCHAHFRAKGGLHRLPRPHLLGPLPLRDIGRHPTQRDDVSGGVEERELHREIDARHVADRHRFLELHGQTRSDHLLVVGPQSHGRLRREDLIVGPSRNLFILQVVEGLVTAVYECITALGVLEVDDRG